MIAIYTTILGVKTIGCRRVLGTALAVGICLGGVTQAASPPGDDPAPESPGQAGSTGQQLAISGWFHVIWNGEPRFMLIDDQGRWTRLLLDEPSTRASGGPQTFNRKRVKVVGVPVASPSGAIRVLHIALE